MACKMSQKVVHFYSCRVGPFIVSRDVSDWFEKNARELVSERILKEVSDFWGSAPVAVTGADAEA